MDAVFTLPGEMFYPGASVNACCMVFNLGISHFTTEIDKNGKEIKKPRATTFFGFFKNDGFTKKKNLGRISKEDENGQIWQRIEQNWLDLYKGNITDLSLGIRKEVTADDEWLAEAYIKTDYSKISESLFQGTLQSYLSYLIKNGYNIYDKIKKISYEGKKSVPDLNTDSWKEFKISDLFDVELSKGDLKEDDCAPGDIPLVSSGSLNNGVVKYIDEDGDGIAQIFPKNKITVDMFGQAYYQPFDFYSVSHGRVNILSAKIKGFNKYIALFICSIINNEQFRFSYNRAVYKAVIESLVIKLPSKQNTGATGENVLDIDNKSIFEPDWQYMEDYIKGLSYADLI